MFIYTYFLFYYKLLLESQKKKYIAIIIYSLGNNNEKLKAIIAFLKSAFAYLLFFIKKYSKKF